MYRNYQQYVPQGRSELIEYIAFLALSGPAFANRYFPEQTLDTVFDAFVEGLGRVQKKLGRERYELLLDLSHRAREHYRADPDSANGGVGEAINLILEIEESLKSSYR
jgi:hypothetical protein